MNLKAIFRELLACRLQVTRAARQDGDPGAGLGEAAGHRDADALAAAGDDGHAIFHRDLHVSFPLSRSSRDQFFSASSNSSGRSAIIMCPAPGSTTVRAFGTAAASALPALAGVIMSRSPRMTVVGTVTPAAAVSAFW